MHSEVVHGWTVGHPAFVICLRCLAMRGSSSASPPPFETLVFVTILPVPIAKPVGEHIPRLSWNGPLITQLPAIRSLFTGAHNRCHSKHLCLTVHRASGPTAMKVVRRHDGRMFGDLLRQASKCHQRRPNGISLVSSPSVRYTVAIERHLERCL